MSPFYFLEDTDGEIILKFENLFVSRIMHQLFLIYFKKMDFISIISSSCLTLSRIFKKGHYKIEYYPTLGSLKQY